MVIEEGAHAIAAIADDVAADVHEVPARSLAKGHFKEGAAGGEVRFEVWHGTIVAQYYVLGTEYSICPAQPFRIPCEGFNTARDRRFRCDPPETAEG